jgi:hypothetical protein
MCAVISSQLSPTFCLASINIINPTFRFCRYPFVALLATRKALGGREDPGRGCRSASRAGPWCPQTGDLAEHRGGSGSFLRSKSTAGGNRAEARQ